MATEKQKRVAKDLMENKGKSVSRAMIDAGYDPRTARNPQQLTNSKSWQQLMEEYLPDHKLAQVHREGLEARRKRMEIAGYDAKGRPLYTQVDEEDYQTRLGYLKEAYRLKGRANSPVVAIQNNGEMTMEFVGKDEGNIT